jgi:hypothetical protein
MVPAFPKKEQDIKQAPEKPAVTDDNGDAEL